MGEHPAKINSVNVSVVYEDGHACDYTYKMGDSSVWECNPPLLHRDFWERGADGILRALGVFANNLKSHQSNTVPDRHWHVEEEKPGYPPGVDVVCLFDDAKRARDLLVQRLRYELDMLPECRSRARDHGNPCDDHECGSCKDYRTILDVLDNPDEHIQPESNDGYVLDVTGGRISRVRYGIVSVPHEQCGGSRPRLFGSIGT